MAGVFNNISALSVTRGSIVSLLMKWLRTRSRQSGTPVEVNNCGAFQIKNLWTLSIDFQFGKILNSRLSNMLSRLVQSTHYKCCPFLNTKFSIFRHRYNVESLAMSRSLIIGLFLLRLGFRLKPFLVEILVDKATLEHFTNPLLRNSPVSIIASRSCINYYLSSKPCNFTN